MATVMLSMISMVVLATAIRTTLVVSMMAMLSATLAFVLFVFAIATW